MEEGKETRDGDPYDESHYKVTISGKKNVQAAIQALVGDNGDYGAAVLQDEGGSIRIMLNPKTVDMEGVPTLEKARAENERLKQEIEEENRKTVAAWEARTGLKYDPEWREHIVRPDGPFRGADGSVKQEAPAEPAAQPAAEPVTQPELSSVEQPSAGPKGEYTQEPFGDARVGAFREGHKVDGHWVGEVRSYWGRRDKLPQEIEHYDNSGRLAQRDTMSFRDKRVIASRTVFNEDGTSVTEDFNPDGKVIKRTVIDKDGNEKVVFSVVLDKLRTLLGEYRDSKYFPKEDFDWETLVFDPKAKPYVQEIFHAVMALEDPGEKLLDENGKLKPEERKWRLRAIRNSKERLLGIQKEREAERRKRLPEETKKRLEAEDKAKADAAFDAEVQKKRETFAKRKYAPKKKNKGRTLTAEEAGKVMKPFASKDATKLMLTKPHAFGGWRFASDGKAILFLRDESVKNGWDKSMPDVRVIALNPFVDTSKMFGRERIVGKLNVPWLMKALDEAEVALTKAGEWHASPSGKKPEYILSIVLLKDEDGNFGLFAHNVYTSPTTPVELSQATFAPSKKWTPVFRGSFLNLRRMGKAMLELGEEVVTVTTQDDAKGLRGAQSYGFSAFDNGSLRAKAVVMPITWLPPDKHADKLSDVAKLDVEAVQSMLDKSRGLAGNTALSTADDTVVPNTPMNAEEAQIIIDSKKGRIYFNASKKLRATINSRQRSKLVSNEALNKSLENGFTVSEHNHAATVAGELFELGTCIEDRYGKLENGKDDVNVRIQRYHTPVTIVRDAGVYDASAYITVKVSTGAKQSEQTPGRIYSLELLELGDLKLKGNGLASNTKHRYTPKSTERERAGRDGEGARAV